MEQRTLPFFRYHPNPEQTGAIVREEILCETCGKKAGITMSVPFIAYQRLKSLVHGASKTEPLPGNLLPNFNRMSTNPLIMKKPSKSF
ncbi:MAG: hypothetical protein CW342_11070 [Thermoactinomycetaceae bacterium]|nr:hypothetical protein [Thermoactinomycetaceae bacterium]